MQRVPPSRVRSVDRATVANEGDYVLYWMLASRRTRWNFALDRAVEWCRELDKPLVILEALTTSYAWASERFSSFVIDGMLDNAEQLQGKAVRYYPYVEPSSGAGRGLLQALGQNACVVVTDEYPSFFLPALVARAGTRLKVRLEAVDSNGLLPLGVADRAFATAHSFRRFLQKQLPSHWDETPRQDALRRLRARPRARIPQAVRSRWPQTPISKLRRKAALLASLPIDHAVPGTDLLGGATAGRRALQRFVSRRLGTYDEKRNQPEAEATSGLSPYLHFGHIGAHEAFRSIMRHEGWSPDQVADRASGARTGWWNVSSAAEAFLDQLVTWRELGFNACHRLPDYDRFESLPDWCRETLEEHASDPRKHVYTLEELSDARTHDPLWNAAQTQLRHTGIIHNYLRMLWGKRVLAWTRHPRDAVAALIELNNRYALDGRDPNSYSGIFWCFGRYDRPWGPEREIFGKVRFMTSKNTARKYRVTKYMRRYASQP